MPQFLPSQLICCQSFKCPTPFTHSAPITPSVSVSHILLSDVDHFSASMSLALLPNIGRSSVPVPTLSCQCVQVPTPTLTTLGLLHISLPTVSLLWHQSFLTLGPLYTTLQGDCASPFSRNSQRTSLSMPWVLFTCRNGVMAYLCHANHSGPCRREDL